MIFKQFIAVDWSGAKGPSLPGLQVAICSQGDEAPQLVLGPAQGRWTRLALLDWLIAQTERSLIGLDFGFAYPFLDRRAYFPEHADTPSSSQALWGQIDRICRNGADLYGGTFYRDRTSPYAEYLAYQTYTGKLHERRLRVTEQESSRLTGASPSSVFVCVGAGSVGCGSVAGMRFLHNLLSRTGNSMTIYPFESVKEDAPVVVEIFPRLYYRQARQDPKRWRDRVVLDACFRHFGSEPPPATWIPSREDESDAMVSVAALRWHNGQPVSWQPSKMSREVAEKEGWIFGVA